MSANTIFPAPLRAAAPYIILALIVFGVYGNIYDNAFVFDDDLLIQLNAYIKSWNHIIDILRGSTTSGAYIAGGFYRPLQILLYLFAFQLGGGSVLPFHILNIGLHIANTCFVYKLGTKLNFKPWGVFLAALLWGIHPLHTEAIVYMSATADPLFAFFCLLSIDYLLPDITPRKILKIIPLFLLGLASKETTVMLPLLVIACLFYVSPDRLKIKTYLRTWPLWIITIGYSVWRMNTLDFDGPQTYARMYEMPQFATLKLYADSLSCRLYTFFATLPVYLNLLVWPRGLHMERSFSIFTNPWNAPVISGMGIALFSAAHCVYSGLKPKKGLPLAWGLVWAAAAHAPDSGLIVPMNSLFLEHWMYLPSVGLFLGLVETLARLLENRAKPLAISCSILTLVFAAILSAKTYAQNAIWHDPPHFYNNIFAYGERSARAHNNLALYYADHGDYPDAVDQFKQAINTADSYAETRHNLALIYLRMPDQKAHVQDAIDNLDRAIQIDPTFYRSYQTLSDIYGVLLNDKEKADFYHARAAELIKLRQ